MDELRRAGYFPSGENAQGSVVNMPIQIRSKARPKPPRISRSKAQLELGEMQMSFMSVIAPLGQHAYEA